MPEDNIRPAELAEIEQALSFALRYQGRKRLHDADALMAQITAERLVAHLQSTGFVVMKRPEARAASTSLHGKAPSTP